MGRQPNPSPSPIPNPIPNPSPNPHPHPHPNLHPHPHPHPNPNPNPNQAWAASDCREQLGALNYRLPPSVGALVDRPSAEAFLDFWWANPNALVLLTRRPALEWVRSRAKFGQAMNLPVDRPNPNPNPNPNGRGRPQPHPHPNPIQAMNLPVDRPCRLSFADASTDELAQLLTLHDELVRCVV